MYFHGKQLKVIVFDLMFLNSLKLCELVCIIYPVGETRIPPAGERIASHDVVSQESKVDVRKGALHLRIETVHKIIPGFWCI